MICQGSIDDIEQLISEGLHPSPADIIRLNALGLREQAARNRNATSSLDYLPRCAVIPLPSPRELPPGSYRIPDRPSALVLRQPTIGHEIWLAEVERIASPDLQTLVSLRAFALSRDWADLPSAFDVDAVKSAVDGFCAVCADLTREQLCAAICYVQRGASQTEGERPAGRADDTIEDERLPDGSEEQDWDYCVAAAVLHDAQAVLVGASVADLKSLTRRQLNELKMNALYIHGLSTNREAENAAKEYQITLDEIRARLEVERDAASEATQRKKPAAAEPSTIDNSQS